MRYVFFQDINLVLYEITRLIAILVDALSGKRNLPIANRQWSIRTYKQVLGFMH